MFQQKGILEKKRIFVAPLFLFMFLLAFLFVLAEIANAQEVISVGINPPQPGPNEEVVVGVESFLLDLDRSRISWSLNGASSKSGFGEKSFSFKTGAAGSVSMISIVVEPQTGERVSQTFIVRPQEVILLWQALTYVPPFYKGKALPASESVIIISAFPELVADSGTRINAGDLFYSWRQDGTALGALSGVGKRSAVLKAKTVPIDETTITLSVSSLDESIEARKQISVLTHEPAVLFYENHPLRGVNFGAALTGSVILESEELTVRAEPFFFSLKDLANEELEFGWSLNGSALADSSVRELVLRKDGGRAGIAKIDLRLRDFASALQEARSALFVSFGD